MKNQKANTTNYVKALCESKGVEIVLEGSNRQVLVNGVVDATFPTFVQALEHAVDKAGVTEDAQVQELLDRAYAEFDY